MLLNISKDERNHTLRNLTPAKYKVWVSAISDAGAGPSRELDFVVYGKQICEWAESICHNIFCMCLRKSSRVVLSNMNMMPVGTRSFPYRTVKLNTVFIENKILVVSTLRICFHPNSLLNFVLYVYHMYKYQRTCWYIINRHILLLLKSLVGMSVTTPLPRL